MSLKSAFDSQGGVSLKNRRLGWFSAAGGSSFRRVAVDARRVRAVASWFLGFENREASSARWECGNRACGDFQGAVGNVGNRSLVFHVFLGPGISTALRKAAPVSSLLHSPLLTSPPGPLLFRLVGGIRGSVYRGELPDGSPTP